MSKPIDLTGQRFGRLTVIKFVGNRSWDCKCDCGRIVRVRGYNLCNGHTASCGCLAKETAANNGRKGLMELSGKRFGKLTVIKYDLEQKSWECLCDCGKTCFVAQNNLCRKKRSTISCGCAVSLDRANEENIVEHTNVGNIRRKEAMSRSKTGIKGVYKCGDRYTATIHFQKKSYYLCSSKDLEKCVKARKEAESHLFGSFLEWYDSRKK